MARITDGQKSEGQKSKTEDKESKDQKSEVHMARIIDGQKLKCQCYTAGYTLYVLPDTIVLSHTASFELHESSFSLASE